MDLTGYIFGGYPWFYKKELYSLDTFPWIQDIDQRLDLLNENIKKLNIKDYVQNQYYQTLQEIDYLVIISICLSCNLILCSLIHPL